MAERAVARLAHMCYVVVGRHWSEGMDKHQLFGGNPLAVVFRLVVLSVVVGIVLSALNVEPAEIFQYIRLFAHRIYSLGLGAISGIFGYFALGAAVVVPVWLISRLFGSIRGSNDRRQP